MQITVSIGNFITSMLFSIYEVKQNTLLVVVFWFFVFIRDHGQILFNYHTK